MLSCTYIKVARRKTLVDIWCFFYRVAELKTMDGCARVTCMSMHRHWRLERTARAVFWMICDRGEFWPIFPGPYFKIRYMSEITYLGLYLAHGSRVWALIIRRYLYVHFIPACSLLSLTTIDEHQYPIWPDIWPVELIWSTLLSWHSSWWQCGKHHCIHTLIALLDNSFAVLTTK